MKIATYNVTQHRCTAARPAPLARRPPSRDVACLAGAEGRPTRSSRSRAIREAGYEAVWHGQKGPGNGVCHPRQGREARGNAARPCRATRTIRIVAISKRSWAGITVGCLYLPNGKPGSGAEVRLQAEGGSNGFSAHAASLIDEGGPVVPRRGTTTVIPTERDVYKPERWVDDALFPARNPRGVPPVARPGLDGFTPATSTRTRRSTPSGTTCGGAFSRKRGPAHRPPAPEPGAGATAEGCGRGRGRAGRWRRRATNAPTWIELGS